MAQPPRRPTSALDRAEAMFKDATTKPAAAPVRPKPLYVPSGKETISLRIDNDVLAFFQEDGPGWQDRINAALRAAAKLT